MERTTTRQPSRGFALASSSSKKQSARINVLKLTPYEHTQSNPEPQVAAVPWAYTRENPNARQTKDRQFSGTAIVKKGGR